ncbi:uncharacterized protein N7479_007535 [Penicillium vulpinum]|uniref:DUF3669 domain-containing protein n=1 Tax=Penicillium vulpinum TaxID=29845 RepID=A0A1V6S9J4_9EURO|nr:uncharacterized protein N7479_007535 [Penicillium vulpinum]KAJ5960385.1 hypothetical protein N7479_007535 [Penicillium vulpinum]OQE10712.1 hypothetical protein PENVUL_c003G05189 [Penicillium vulpinum]
MTKLQTIGRGACGTVWASETGPAYKREDGNPARSLRNDFEMHNRVLRSQHTLMSLGKSTKVQIQIPSCHKFIESENKEWWAANLERFPQGYTSCNMIEAQRIPPFGESIRQLLIQEFCPDEIKQKIINSEPDRDCLIRLYLGRRRTHTRDSKTFSRFKAFSLRNYPLHNDQLEELAITADDLRQYARTMAEGLAMMHWVAGIDANDVEFVLAPCNDNDSGRFNNVLGRHSMWILDFDRCRNMTMDEDGVGKAVKTFWRNDPFYPRPGNSLWDTFRDQYIHISDECLELRDVQEREKQRFLSRLFIKQVESWGTEVNS